MDLVIMGFFMIISFFMGRYSVKKVEEKPKEPVKEKSTKIKITKHDDDFRLDEATITMLENIDNYDGTGLGQKDVPEEV